MRWRSILLALLGFTLAPACSTKLTVNKIEASSESTSPAASPNGLIVNRLATYSVAVKANPNFRVVVEAKPVSVVDPHQVLELDYCRYPFADGKLVVELAKGTQTLIKAGVSGTTPATNAVKAADSIVGTANQIHGLGAEPAAP